MDDEGVKGGSSAKGHPYLEISRKAVQVDAQMIVMGCSGNAGDMEFIFFRSTTERVLKFIKRPVL